MQNIQSENLYFFKVICLRFEKVKARRHILYKIQQNKKFIHNFVNNIFRLLFKLHPKCSTCDVQLFFFTS